jgi:wyosine [tRNA(Phe)-imidazoG37] synthetase (radical SAM superfamily)
MSEGRWRYSFGPVPSRRLGKSLGINNIPAKVCSYSCLYCQVGRTTAMQVERRSFYEVEAIVSDVRNRVEQARKENTNIDVLTFVPDGEPTLDVNLGKEITLLKTLGFPVGVITNSSLIWRDDVRSELANADWVSLKMDAVRESAWRRINRPQCALRLTAILDGALAFAKTFSGKLVTETMLVQGNDENEAHLREIAQFLQQLQPAVAYLSVPTRPPAEKGVHGPDENTLNRAFQIIGEKVTRLEYLIGYEGDAFASTGDIEKDLLSITAVHPMRKEAVNKLLAQAGATWTIVERLLARAELTATEYEGHMFYLRRFKKRFEQRPSPSGQSAIAGNRRKEKEMEKNENIEVLEGEIVDDAKEKSVAFAANEVNVEKKENRMEKAGKWIDTVAIIGGGLLKFFSIFSKTTPFDRHGNSGKNDSSSGRRRRRQGKR